MTSDLQAQIQALSERLAEYESTVADAVALLGHEGSEPVDLRDALGQVERLVGGQDLESCDLSGLAEDIRSALWHRDRVVSLLTQTQERYLRRTTERDIAQAQLTRFANDHHPAALLLDLLLHATAHDTPVAVWLLDYVTARVHQLDVTALLASVRTTWVVRDTLPNWTAARDAVAAELRRRGHDPAVALAGLHEAPCDG